jgi:hypothetical protein
MGLLRGIARTAVIAGTATSVSNRVSRRQAGRWASKDQQQQQEQYDDEQEAGPPESSMPSKLDQLQQLGELKQQGVLTEEEFLEQKRQILES